MKAQIRDGAPITHNGQFFKWPNCMGDQGTATTHEGDMIFDVVKSHPGAVKGLLTLTANGFGSFDLNAYGNGPILVAPQHVITYSRD